MDKPQTSVTEISLPYPGLLNLLRGILNYLRINVQFEHGLWQLRFRTFRQIRSARRYPNDENLGNLILFRHRLRQVHYYVENELKAYFKKDSKSYTRLRSTTQSMIERLEEAIVQTENSLNPQ